MNRTLQTQGNGKAPPENFMVISRTEDGYRVFLASQPEKQYFVHGNLDNPSCTCDAFAENAVTGGTCEHYRAVCKQFSEDDPVAREERLAIQTEGQLNGGKKRRRSTRGSPATMTLKRSVSPDGRIDSLSVELACPIDQVSAADIKARAENMIKLQREIASGFLASNGKSNGHAKLNSNGNGRGNGSNGSRKTDDSLPAKMLNIGATRNGNFFISFQANGKGAKLFGTGSELAEAIRSAGFQYSEEDVADGVYLNLPCRVITKATSDGRYINVNRVLPASSQRRAGQ